MNGLGRTLDRETQLLISTGAAVAAGCIPCLENIVAMARAEGIDEKKLRAAARTGQYVKEQPANMMKAFSDELLGTHMQSQPGATGSTGEACPMTAQDGDGMVTVGVKSGGGRNPAGGCGCS